MHTMADEHPDTMSTTPINQPALGAVQTGKEYSTVKEGLAYILIPKEATAKKDPTKGPEADSQSQSVFYNPIQQFNRDLSVLAIRVFGEDAIAARRQRRGENSHGQATKGRGRKRKRGDVDDTGVTNGGDRRTTSGFKRGLQKNGAASSEPDARSSEGTISTGGTGNDMAVDESTKDSGTRQEEASTAEVSTAEVKEPPNTSENTSISGHEHITAGTRDIASETPITTPWKPAFTILDALSATGLRALRYAKEIPFVTEVTANDLSREAAASIQLNVQNNKLEDKIFPITSDARAHMYHIAGQQAPKQPGGHVGKYDVIDLDPYGTAAPFFDAAVQSVVDGGLLCVTCTDSGVFASTGYLEKSYALYGGLPMKGQASHEGGLRLIIHAIATSAARYGLAIEPLLSLSIDFYIRIFVRVRRSPAEVKYLAGKSMIVYNCDSGCGAWTTQFLARHRATEGKKGTNFYKHTLALGPSATEYCEHCGFKTHVAGPMWAGPLHNPSFIQRILDLLPTLDEKTYATIPRIEGMLSTALEEDISTPSPNDTVTEGPSSLSFERTNPVSIDHHPFFIIPSTLSKVIHCQTPSEDAMRGALRHLGYKVTRSHAKPGSIRTNAPWTVLWEVMREWMRQKSPVKEGASKKGTAGWGVMQKSRALFQMRRLKEEVRAAVEKGEDLEALKTEVEAAFYRTSRAQGTEKGQGEESGDVGLAEAAAAGKTKAEGNMDGHGALDVGKLKIVFDEELGRQREEKKLVRYQVNPRANWGPMNRAKVT